VFRCAVVEPLDIVEHIGSGLVPRAIGLAGHALDFEGREEALHRRVVPHVARAAQAACHPVLSHQPLERLARILAAAIGMVQQLSGPAAPPDRHHQCVGDEFGRHRRAHRPANHTPREQVDDGRYIEPTLARPDVGEVRHPFAVGRRRREAAVEHIRRGCRRRSVAEVDRQSPSSRTCSQPIATHQALDRVQPALYPGSQQVVPHPPSAVCAIAVRKARSNLCAQHLVTARAGTRAPRQPRVEPTARDTERLAKESHRPDPPVLRDEPKDHVWSFAK
jgi:hypothetical protein